MFNRNPPLPVGWEGTSGAAAGGTDAPMSDPNPPSHGRSRATPWGARPLPRPPKGRGGPVQAGGPPPLVNRSTCPPDRGSFAAVARASALLSSSSVEGLVRLAKAFPELPTSHLQDMQKRSGSGQVV
jgi:hypothetical protein